MFVYMPLLLVVATTCFASLPPPGTELVASLVPSSPAEAQWYQQQLEWQQLQVNWAAQQLGAASGRKKRSLPAPGTASVAGLVPNPAAEAQWYQQQLLWQQEQLNVAAQQLGAAYGRKKRSLPNPGTAPVAGLVTNPTAEAQWYQQQLLWQQEQLNVAAQQLGAAYGRKKRSLPNPGTAPVAGLVTNPTAEAQWYQQQLLWQQEQLNVAAQQLGAAYGRKKRSAFAPGTPAWAAWTQMILEFQQAQLNHIAPSPGPGRR